jgi:polygalacturonase
MKQIAALAVVVLGAATSLIQSAESTGKVFAVRQFGAKGDGQTLDTAAIQKALDECGKAGGGTVKFPPGTYLSQPVALRSKTTLLLEAGAKLQATTNQADFMKTPHHPGQVIACPLPGWCEPDETPPDLQIKPGT